MSKHVPSVGRIVHYMAYGTPGGEFPVGEPRAAVVTEVNEPKNPDSPIGVAVLNPQGMFFNRNILKATRPQQPGCWGLAGVYTAGGGLTCPTSMT